MRKFIFAVAIATCSVSFLAIAPRAKAAIAVSQEKTTKIKDGVMMMDGRMYVVKGGEATEMTKAVIMSNGTKVLTNGEVFLKNGDSLKLENGDVVHMNGRIEKAKGLQ